MGYNGTYKDVGLTKMDIIVILKSIANKTLLFDQDLVTRNYQSIFNYREDLIQFLNSYNPKSYFNDYCNERISEFEKKLRFRLLTPDEISKDEQVSFPRKEMTAREKYRPKDYKGSNQPPKHGEAADLDTRNPPSRNTKGSEKPNDLRPIKNTSAPSKFLENKNRERFISKDPRTQNQGQKINTREDDRKKNSPHREEKKEKQSRRRQSTESSSSRRSTVSRNKRNSKDKRRASTSQSRSKKGKKTNINRNNSSSSKNSSTSNKSTFC